MSDSSEDRIYRDPSAAATPFRFDERVAQVFDDMIRRSVPGYGEVQTLTAERILQLTANRDPAAPLRVLDLGCSTGCTLHHTAACRNALKLSHAIEWIGVDLSAPMLDKAREAWGAAPADHRSGITVDWEQNDVRDVRESAVDVILLQYTLQFLPPEERPNLLRRWAGWLRPGGLLLLSEKICYEQAEQQAAHTEAHLSFKRKQGYSELEIAGKRQALENVLHTEQLATNERWLAEAGLEPVVLEGCWDVFAMLRGNKPGRAG